MYRIHVNQHVIKANRKTGDNKPVFTIKEYSKSGKTCKSNRYAHEIEICGTSRIIYSPDAPLSCGAVAWIETEGEVIIIR